MNPAKSIIVICSVICLAIIMLKSIANFQESYIADSLVSVARATNTNWNILNTHFHEAEKLDEAVMSILVKDGLSFKDFILDGNASVKNQWHIEYKNIPLIDLVSFRHKHINQSVNDYTISGVRVSGVELLPNNTLALFFTNVDYNIVKILEAQLDNTSKVNAKADGTGIFKYALTESGMYEIGIYQIST